MKKKLLADKVSIFKNTTIALLLSSAILSSSTFAASNDDRIAQLERMSSAHAQLLLEFQQQLTANQQDIDNLRGQMQQLQYQLEQAVNVQNKLQNQFSQIVPESATDNTSTSPASSPRSSSQIATPVNVSFSGDENKDYNAAVALVLEAKQYEQAIGVFQAFNQQYPNSHYAPNANYWIAQSYYSVGNKDEAAKYFAMVVKNYPDSPKSSDAMLKVGQILEEKGDKDKSMKIYQEVQKKYPQSEAATKASQRLSN